MSDLFGKIVDDFFEEGIEEVDNYLERIGAEAVEINKEQGNYHDRTGHLRRSNFYKVENHELVIGNKASYSSDVSNRGYNVIDSGIQYLRKELEDML